MVIETFTLFGIAWLFYLVIIIFIIVCIIAELDQNGVTAFWALLILSVLMYFGGDISVVNINWLKLLGQIGIYIGIGFLYSLVRTYLMVVDKKAESYVYKKPDEDADKQAKAIKELQNHIIDDLKGNVTRWWLLCGISMPMWIMSKGWTVLYDLTGGIFRRIVKSVIK